MRRYHQKKLQTFGITEYVFCAQRFFIVTGIGISLLAYFKYFLNIFNTLSGGGCDDFR